MPTPRKKQPADAAKKPAPKPRPTARKSAKGTTSDKPTGVEPAAARRGRSAATGNGDGDGARRGYDLVIVESPAKAKTINKYLGSNYKVLASYGHVRDLPRRRKKGEQVAGIPGMFFSVPVIAGLRIIVIRMRRPKHA